MKIKGNDHGYTMWLSGQDIEMWATRPRAIWPCSTLRGYRVVAQVDSDGLCDLKVVKLTTKRPVDPSFVDGNELEAIIKDHLPLKYRYLWPVWALHASMPR